MKSPDYLAHVDGTHTFGGSVGPLIRRAVKTGRAAGHLPNGTFLRVEVDEDTITLKRGKGRDLVIDRCDVRGPGERG